MQIKKPEEVFNVLFVDRVCDVCDQIVEIYADGPDDCAFLNHSFGQIE